MLKGFLCRPRVRLWLPGLGSPGIQLDSGFSRRDARAESFVGEEDLIAKNARLRRENQELRDTNELLKAASAFFASELGPQRRK